jgi:hypothetical protein
MHDLILATFRGEQHTIFNHTVPVLDALRSAVIMPHTEFSVVISCLFFLLEEWPTLRSNFKRRTQLWVKNNCFHSARFNFFCTNCLKRTEWTKNLYCHVLPLPLFYVRLRLSERKTCWTRNVFYGKNSHVFASLTILSISKGPICKSKNILFYWGHFKHPWKNQCLAKPPPIYVIEPHLE